MSISQVLHFTRKWVIHLQARFKKSGYKFNKWYDIIFMKKNGEHN